MSAQNRKDLASGGGTDDPALATSRPGPFTEMFKDLDERIARAARIAREDEGGAAD